MLSLDELANIAPLPELESILSQGAGQGVTISWAAQSLAQVRHRWGREAADAIWSASTARVIFGGLASEQDLTALEKLIGEQQVKTTARSRYHDHVSD